MPGITLRMARPEDAGGMLAVYAPYVEHSTASWEYEAPSLAEFSGRLREHLDTGFPWLLAEEDGAVLAMPTPSLRRTPGLRLGRRGHSIPVCRRTPEARRHRAVHRIAGSAAQAGLRQLLCAHHTPQPGQRRLPRADGLCRSRAPAPRGLQGRPVAGSFLLSAHVAAASCRARAACAAERAGRRRNGTITARRGSPVPSRAGGALNGI